MASNPGITNPGTSDDNALSLLSADGKPSGKKGDLLEGNKTPWLLPTSDFLNLDKYGAVLLPAIGASATILTFTVAQGRNCRVNQLGIDFTANGGAAFVQNFLPFQLQFSIVTDNPLQPLPDYGSFNYLPGAVSLPVPIAGLMLKEGQVVNVLVKNLTLAVTAQTLGARLLGYLYPKKREQRNGGFQ